MKSRIRIASQRKILAVNVDKVKLERISGISGAVGAELVTVSPEKGGEKVGFLLGYEGYSHSDNTELCEKEVVLFSGFDNRALNQILSAMRKYDCSVDLKCTVTPTNRDWTLTALSEEIFKEHNLMHGVDKNG